MLVSASTDALAAAISRTLVGYRNALRAHAVPCLLEIGIPGLLYVALCFFFAGAFVRTFPSLSTTACGAFGVIISIRALWSSEQVLDATLRPKPFSTIRRAISMRHLSYIIIHYHDSLWFQLSSSLSVSHESGAFQFLTFLPSKSTKKRIKMQNDSFPHACRC